jgi:hypothetical protein
MPNRHVRLKDVLRARRWQTYRTFCREYDRAAKDFDSSLVGSWPSRAQLHRWLSGDLKGLPYPDHCQVLERMFPDWTAEQLFELCAPVCPQEAESGPDATSAAGVAQSIRSGLANPEGGRVEWGDLAPRETATPLASEHAIAVTDETALPELLAQKLLALGHAGRVPPAEISQLSSLAGNVVDLRTEIELVVEKDGACSVTYAYETLNLTDRPIARVSRDLWFQHPRNPLQMEPHPNSTAKLVIQRLHTADNMVKFAVHLSPPISPGDVATFGYCCSGAEFRDDLYWRQAIARFTRHFTLSVRHKGVETLTGLTAVEELPNGTERLAQQSTTWDYDGADAVMKLTLDYLRPNQYATLRWETA